MGQHTFDNWDMLPQWLWLDLALDGIGRSDQEHSDESSDDSAWPAGTDLVS